MAFTKSTTETAITGVDDIQLSIDRRIEGGVAVYYATVTVILDSGRTIGSTVPIAAALTPTERSTLRTLLTKIRDYALGQAGFTNV